MRHQGMLIIGIAVATLVLGAAPAAQAANPDVNRFISSNSLTDPDFCGTGQAVDINGSVSVVEFLSPNHVDYAQAVQGKVTLTNPETGATVINQFAGRSTDLFVVSGDPEGIHTREFTQIGLGEQWRLENGGVLTLDAGYLAVLETWNGDQYLSAEYVINKGPHPDADSDFALFCQVIPDALGL
jgi:hypothetical protein